MERVGTGPPATQEEARSVAAAQCAEHVALAEKLRCDAEEAVALAKIHRDEGTTERRQLEAERRHCTRRRLNWSERVLLWQPI